MKKRVFSLILAFAMIIPLVQFIPVSAIAADSDFDIQNGVLIKYNGKGGVVVVPEGVTKIGRQAFYEGYGASIRIEFDTTPVFTSITLPSTLKEIDDEAFHGTSISSIVIPSGVTRIGNNAFCYNEKLKSIIIPDSVTDIGRKVFYDCIELTSVTLPKSITSISESMFSGCEKLSQITLPASVEFIGDMSFYECKSLKSIILHEGIRYIGRGAFDDCGLTSINIPTSVTEIADNPFMSSISLESTTVAAGNPNYASVNGVLYNKDLSQLLIYPAGKKDVSYTIPMSVKSMGSYAFSTAAYLNTVVVPEGFTTLYHSMFQNCDNLKSIKLPGSLKKIEAFAFSGCTNLTDIVIPGGVTEIESFAFQGCKSITSLTLPAGIKYIGISLFENTGLKSVNIPNGVTIIEDNAFQGCTELASVTIPNSVQSIGVFAFDNCDLTSVVIPYSVTHIGQGAFRGCSQLKNITLSSNITYMDINVFAGTKWYDDQPEGMVYIGPVAYAYKGKMPDNTSITIKSGTKTIAGGAFFQSNIKSVVIPEGVTNICYRSFSECGFLTSVTLPKSLKVIDSYAFNSCQALTSIVFTENIIEIGESAFVDCTKLKYLTFSSSIPTIRLDAFYNTAWVNEAPEGFLFANKTLYDYIGKISNKTDIVIPDGTLYISGHAFRDRRELTNLIIPSSVKGIMWPAFTYYSMFASWQLPDLVISGYSGTAAENYSIESNFPFISLGALASPTKSTVYVDGVKVDFEAYTIGNNNYIKLRDFAASVNGTQKQFSVEYNSATQEINLVTGQPYQRVGGEFSSGNGADKPASPTQSKVYINNSLPLFTAYKKDGAQTSFTAYTIGGNNFFKLRDLASAFDIGVTYDPKTGNVGIDTSIGYTAP